MPQTNEGVFLIVGAAFFLIGFFGEKLEISAIKIHPMGKWPRLILVGIGAVFMLSSIFRLFLSPSPPSPPSTAVADAPTSIVAAVSTRMDMPVSTVTPLPPTDTPAPISQTDIPQPTLSPETQPENTSPPSTFTPIPMPTNNIPVPTNTSLPPLLDAHIKGYENIQPTGTRHISLGVGELIVGTADRFQDDVTATGQPPCTAFVIVGPIEMDLMVWYGGWDHWANVRDKEVPGILLAQKVSELEQHQACLSRGINQIAIP